MVIIPEHDINVEITQRPPTLPSGDTTSGIRNVEKKKTKKTELEI